jgi:hypothetical protein
MIALLLALSASNLSGLTVPAPANPDSNLVSRNLLPDGTIGECRRVMEDRPGWLPYRCETGPFLGRSVYRPLATASDSATSAWVDPLQTALRGGARPVLQRTRNDGDN